MIKPQCFVLTIAPPTLAPASPLSIINLPAKYPSGRLNVDPMRDKTEKNNQRFLIHIVPKNIITENY